MDNKMPKGVVVVDDFLEHGRDRLMVDVRAPLEYKRGHIPGAVNIPVFTDEQRALVGTEYHRKGQQPAILLGLSLIGPELTGRCRQLMDCSPVPVTVSLYCWRGGMRSAAMEWLFNLIGYPTRRLGGGYKAYRRHVLEGMAVHYNLRVVSGATGSGKTEILHHLADMGEQVLDLEGLANHRGSAFGGLGMPPQPGTEHFENLIYDTLSRFNPARVIWVEDESVSVGNCFIPVVFYEQMKKATVYVVQVGLAERVARLVKVYGDAPTEQLATALQKIKKRLGGDKLKPALEALAVNNLDEVARIALSYYDKTYLGGLNSRTSGNIFFIEAHGQEPVFIARQLSALAGNLG